MARITPNLVVTVGEYGRVLWRVTARNFDDVTLENLAPVAGSPRRIVVAADRVKPWAGSPRPTRTIPALRAFNN